MTSSKTNGNYDKVMEDANKAFQQIADGLHRLADRTASAAGIAVHQPQTAKSGIYTRIADNLVRVNDMLNGEKAEEYGNPRTMFQNISKRWFGCDNEEVEVAIMMAELKIERIKFDHSKEDSYLDAIAYLVMALSFMQEGEKND
jgi:hypothetical protein